MLKAMVLAVALVLAVAGCTIKFEASVLKQIDRPGEIAK